MINEDSELSCSRARDTYEYETDTAVFNMFFNN